MGRLAGFRYREVVRRLKKLGFQFDRQVAGGHEIWFNATTNRYTTIPNHPGDLPEGTQSRQERAGTLQVTHDVAKRLIETDAVRRLGGGARGAVSVTVRRVAPATRRSGRCRR